jgi:hypothetical protein
MSLTSFIAQPDVRAKFRQIFPHFRFHLKNRPLMEPLTKHYTLVGTAFDYLLRFALQQRYAHAIATPWVAELATGIRYPLLLETFGQEKADLARQFVEEAREHHAQYLLDGNLTDDLLHSVLLLAQIDPFFRASVLHEPFGEVNLQDVADLRRLFAAIPFANLTSQSLCLLDPTFGASSLVGGADVDLVLDGIMIDVKTTRYLEMKREYVNQLLGYYTLSLLAGITGMPEGQTIRKVGVYFSRHGYLCTCSIDQIAAEDTFAEFSSWFAARARQQYGELKI